MLTTIVYILLVFILLLMWGIYGRLLEIHQDLFEMKYPEMHDDNLFAEYLGKAKKK